MRLILRNDFHNSITELNVPNIPCTLSEGQSRKVRRELCGSKTCTCGAVRGPQWHGSHRLQIDMDSAGRYMIEYEWPEDFEEVDPS